MKLHLLVQWNLVQLKASADVILNEQSYEIKNKLYKYAQQNNKLVITPHIAGLIYDSEKKALNYAFNELKKHLNLKNIIKDK